MQVEGSQSAVEEKVREENLSNDLEKNGTSPLKASSSLYAGPDSLTTGKSTRMALTTHDEHIRLAPSPLAIKLQHLQIMYSTEIPLKQIDETLLRFNGDAERAASFLFSAASGEETKADDAAEKKGALAASSAFFKNLRSRNMPSMHVAKKGAKAEVAPEESAVIDNRHAASTWKNSTMKLLKIKSFVGMHASHEEDSEKKNSAELNDEAKKDENVDASNEDMAGGEGNFVRSPPVWKSEAEINPVNPTDNGIITEVSTSNETDPNPST